jgi:hypothetical protein
MFKFLTRAPSLSCNVNKLLEFSALATEVVIIIPSRRINKMKLSHLIMQI